MAAFFLRSAASCANSQPGFVATLRGHTSPLAAHPTEFALLIHKAAIDLAMILWALSVLAFSALLVVSSFLP